MDIRTAIINEFSYLLVIDRGLRSFFLPLWTFLLKWGSIGEGLSEQSMGVPLSRICPLPRDEICTHYPAHNCLLSIGDMASPCPEYLENLG